MAGIKPACVENAFVKLSKTYYITNKRSILSNYISRNNDYKHKRG